MEDQWTMAPSRSPLSTRLALIDCHYLDHTAGQIKAKAMASRAVPMGRQQHRSPTSVASPGASGGDGGNRLGSNSNDAAAGGAKQVTPPTKQLNKSEPPTHPEMEVPQNIIDELLLVLSVIGSDQSAEEAADNADNGNTATAAKAASAPDAAAAAGEGEGFVPVTDAIKWLQDFQRVVRRDQETYRPISLLLGKWRVVPQKLLPLVMNCRYDNWMVMTLCKILVLLTKPMSENAKKAGRLVIDVRSGKVEDSVIREQRLLRDNAIAQSDLLMEYKKLFVRHSSHHYVFQKQGHKQQRSTSAEEGGTAKTGSGLLSIFTSLLVEPMSKTGSARTASDHMRIELVLHLFRNLLCISPINTFGSTEKSQYALQLHRELLIVLKEEMVFDVLVCLGQDVERRENMGYNLLLMEIMSLVLKGQDPSDVALSALQPAMPSLSAPMTLTTANKKKSTKAPTRIIRTTVSRANHSGPNSLKAHLQSERQKLQLSASSRHSHFGGTLLVAKPGGKQTYVSASDYLSKKSRGGSAAAKGATAGISAPTRRKNKKAEVFVGSIKSSTINTRLGTSTTVSRDAAGPTCKRAKLALNSFCEDFFKDCYGPLMKSLKNEFRKDSGRLEDGDRTMFFRIVWFFHQWWRVGMENKKKDDNAGKRKIMAGTKSAEVVDGVDEEESSASKSSAHNLIFTMDVFMFNLVLNSTDEFFEHKKPAALTQTVSLYSEMIQMLHAMFDSADPTERMMALGLMDRLFYASDPLDRLPKLLSRWTPGMYSREYLCDLVECAHTTWKLLDTNAQRCLQSVPADESERKRPKHAVERMNMTAAEFDKDHYFARKFVSNQIVFMYTQLLSQYSVNAPHVNRHIVAYFIRLCKFSIKNAGVDGEDDLGGDFDDALGKNELATKPSTMEPMLYNIGLFSVLEKVLNDMAIRDKDDFEALLMFASSFMKRFARAAEANPMLYVESLFKHPIPHRFCELTTNMYVSEELRMIAVRDLLLEDQKRYEQQAEVEEGAGKKDEDTNIDKVAEDKVVENDDDEEEELEFNDDDDDDDGMFDKENIVSKKKRRRKSRKSCKSKKSKVDDDVQMSEEENQSDNEENEDEEEEELNDKGDADLNANSKEENGANMESQRDNEDESQPAVEDTDTEDAAAPSGDSPKLSGKKRIRKSLEKEHDDSDDDEDFLGSSAIPSKSTKRVIFEEDDDDE